MKKATKKAMRGAGKKKPKHKVKAIIINAVLGKE